MSHHIINEPGVHLNQRTQILEDMIGQPSHDATNTRSIETKAGELQKHSKVSVMLDRFLEICPA